MDIYLMKPVNQNIKVFDFSVDANLYACEGLDNGGNPINCEDAFPDTIRNVLDDNSPEILVDANGHIEIPNSYTWIDEDAFFSDNVNSFTIPNSVIYFGEEAYENFVGDIYIIKPANQYIDPYHLPHTSSHFVCESVDVSGNPIGCEDLWQSTINNSSNDQSEVTEYDALDIDQNGRFDALTDDLILLRYAFGLRNEGLINGVIDTDANRTSAAEIEAHIQSLVP